ncbi:hypothetical protein BC628DRAFT_816214 [Trametes gibbosa]|nr:hypothetical protein BC628DRAFT_816214 [Trametes gibbosa]
MCLRTFPNFLSFITAVAPAQLLSVDLENSLYVQDNLAVRTRSAMRCQFRGVCILLVFLPRSLPVKWHRHAQPHCPDPVWSGELLSFHNQNLIGDVDGRTVHLSWLCSLTFP